MALTLINIKNGNLAGTYILIRVGYKTYNIYDYLTYNPRFLNIPLAEDFHGTKQQAILHFRHFLNNNHDFLPF